MENEFLEQLSDRMRQDVSERVFKTVTELQKRLQLTDAQTEYMAMKIADLVMSLILDTVDLCHEAWIAK